MKKQRKRLDEAPSKRNLKKAFVFFIGDEGAILSYFENNIVIKRLYSAEYDSRSTDTFKELLTTHPQAPIHMLVDLMDQSYVRHSLPPVTPLGVNKIIQRRLARDFAPDDLKGAISLGRDKKGRKDWNFLLVSLSYSAFLKNWCELIYDLPNRFTGVYLAPIESQKIIKRMNQSLYATPEASKKTFFAKKKKDKSANKESSSDITKWDILVIHHKTGGFRQVVLKNEQLVFTRMAQSSHQEKSNVVAGNIEQEVKNTIEYLKRLSFSDTSHLNIMMVLGEDIRNEIDPKIFNANVYRVLTPYEAAELIDIQHSLLSGDRYGDIFISAAFMIFKKPELKLIPNAIAKIEKYYKGIKAAKVAGLILSIFLIGAAGLYSYQLLISKNMLVDLNQEKSQLARRVQYFEEKAVDFEVDPFIVDSLIKINDLIYKTMPQYTVIIDKVTEFVNEELIVSSFEWGITKDNNASTPIVKNDLINHSIILSDNIISKSIVNVTVNGNKQANQDALERWKKIYQNMQESFTGYTLKANQLSGIDSEKDELEINFENYTENKSEKDKTIDVSITIESHNQKDVQRP